MKDLISKELLSLVLGKEVQKIADSKWESENEICYLLDDRVHCLNMDTLSKLCIDKICSLFYEIKIKKVSNGWIVHVMLGNQIVCSCNYKDLNTTIIKAEEWVAKEKGLL